MIIQRRQGTFVRPVIRPIVRSGILKIQKLVSMINTLIHMIKAFILFFYNNRSRIFGTCLFGTTIWGFSSLSGIITGLIFGTLVPTIILLQIHYPNGPRKKHK